MAVIAFSHLHKKLVSPHYLLFYVETRGCRNLRRSFRDGSPC